MYREQHVLVYRTESAGKLVWNFTPRQFGWLFLGAYLTLTLVQSLPKIPGIGIWGYAPHTVPLIICIGFAYGNHTKTGLSLFGYLVSWISCRMRKRVFSNFS